MTMSIIVALALALALTQDAASVREGHEPGGEQSKVMEQLPEAIALIRAGQAGEALRKLKDLDKASGGTCAECVLAMAVAHRRLTDEKAALAAARRVVGMTQDAALLVQAYEMIGERLAMGKYKKANAKTKARLEEADVAFARILERTSSAGPGPLQEFRNNALGSRVALLLKLGRRADAEALAAPLLETAPESETAKPRRAARSGRSRSCAARWSSCRSGRPGCRTTSNGRWRQRRVPSTIASGRSLSC